MLCAIIINVHHFGCINSWNKLGETPLHVATKHGDIKLVKLFLEKDADIHAKVSQIIDVEIIIINTNNYY